MAKVSKKDAEKLFVTTWEKKYPNLELVTQFRPVKELYEKTETDLKFKKWYQGLGYEDFRLDALIVKHNFGIEINGIGWGHQGNGRLRDYRKNNLCLELGYTIWWVSAQEVKDHCDLICKRIYRLLEKK